MCAAQGMMPGWWAMKAWSPTSLKAAGPESSPTSNGPSQVLGSLEPAAGLTCGSQRQSRGGRHEERREDQLTPVRYHEFFRDQLPNCRLEVIPDSGHWPYAEQPEIFDRAVSGFLDTRSLII